MPEIYQDADLKPTDTCKKNCVSGVAKKTSAGAKNSLERREGHKDPLARWNALRVAIGSLRSLTFPSPMTPQERQPGVPACLGQSDAAAPTGPKRQPAFGDESCPAGDEVSGGGLAGVTLGPFAL